MVPTCTAKNHKWETAQPESQLEFVDVAMLWEIVFKQDDHRNGENDESNCCDDGELAAHLNDIKPVGDHFEFGWHDRLSTAQNFKGTRDDPG